MKIRAIISALALAAMFVVPAQRASAGIGDGIVGGVVGGVIGGVIVNEGIKYREGRRRYGAPAPGPARAPAPAVAHSGVRQVQTSLNYFGFNAGYPDGVSGRNTRNAISRYQAFMEYPVTGRLTEFQGSFLIDSYGRAMAGGRSTDELVATLPRGRQELLLRYRADMAGEEYTPSLSSYGLPEPVRGAVQEIARSSDPTAEQLLDRAGFLQLADLNGDGRTDYVLDTSVTGSTFWCGTGGCSVSVFASTPTGYERNDFLARNATPAMFVCSSGTCQMRDDGSTTAQGGTNGVTEAAADAGDDQNATGFALPTFAEGLEGPSLASHCNQVGLLTASNGGLTTVSSMDDPGFALSEQFCLARSYAIAQSDEMVSRLSGFTPARVEEQCLGLAPALKQYVAALSLSPRDEVLQDVGGFVLDSGMSPTQLGATGRICLGVGYRIDDMDVAVGSALLLAALGEAAYEELLGHHLSQGIGASERPGLALAWYDHAIDAIDAGAAPVFAPAQSGRGALLRKAAYDYAGEDAAGSDENGASVVPVFSLQE